MSVAALLTVWDRAACWCTAWWQRPPACPSWTPATAHWSCRGRRRRKRRAPSGRRLPGGSVSSASPGKSQTAESESSPLGLFFTSKWAQRHIFCLLQEFLLVEYIQYNTDSHTFPSKQAIPLGHNNEITIPQCLNQIHSLFSWLRWSFLFFFNLGSSGLNSIVIHFCAPLLALSKIWRFGSWQGMCYFTWTAHIPTIWVAWVYNSFFICWIF